MGATRYESDTFSTERNRLAVTSESRSSIIHQREPNRKTGADPRRAVDFDRAVVIFDDFLSDVEPEPCAALALLGREVRIENLRHLSRLDPSASVLNADINVKILADACHRHGTFLVTRGLDGIDDHVLDRAGHLG